MSVDSVAQLIMRSVLETIVPFAQPVYNHLGEKEDPKCPFCRTSICESNKTHVGNIMKRVELGDATAIYNIGCYYRDGDIGDFGDGEMYQFPQDIVRAIHHFVRAGELGCAEENYNVGVQYENGNVIPFCSFRPILGWP
eukprot:scaffold53588_cov59-Cyclotella_meneghiniana.AAC.1